jgi:hypothetical protein
MKSIDSAVARHALCQLPLGMWQRSCFVPDCSLFLGHQGMGQPDINASDNDDVDPILWPIVQVIGIVAAIALWGIAAFVLAGRF